MKWKTVAVGVVLAATAAYAQLQDNRNPVSANRRLNALLSPGSQSCYTGPCDLRSGTTVGGVAIGGGAADNLGNHTATQNLDFNGYDALNLDRLDVSTWYVDTPAEWDTAVSECESRANVPANDDVGGRIIVTNLLKRDCNGKTGTCFETPAVYRNNDALSDTLIAPCSIEFLNPGLSSSSVTNFNTATGLECQNTNLMTAEDGIKACLRIGASGAKIVNASINTSAGPDASTVGIWIQSESDTCGPSNNQTCAISDVVLENVSVRSEDTTSSGRGIAMAFTLGADIIVNDISGYSTAGIDFIDIGSYAFSNSIWIHGPGGIRTTQVGVLCDSAYDSQQFKVGPLVMESNGINVHAAASCAANFEIDGVYQEGCNNDVSNTTDPGNDCPNTPIFQSTEGVKIENASSHAKITGTIHGSFFDELYAIRRTTSPTTQDDIADVKFYDSLGVSYPAGRGIILNGDYSNSINPLGHLTANCTLENDSTPIPDSCVAGGADLSGSGASVDVASLNTETCGNADVTATGVASTDAVIWSFNGPIDGVTGFNAASASGSLNIHAYPVTNAIRFRVCNPTASTVDPGAFTVNWRVIR